MKIIFQSLMIVAVLMAALVFIPSELRAEEMNFTVNSYVTKMESIPIADAEGHAFVLAERRGLATFDDGRVAAYHTSYICDISNGIGSCEGYSDLTFMDKSKTFSKWKLNAEVPGGKQPPKHKGKGSFTKGTGKYEGIEGNLSFYGYYVTPYNDKTKGDQVTKVSGSYKLPAK